MSIKKQVKNLLLAGKSQSVIARQLAIPRSNVSKMKQEIIGDRIAWNKKKTMLQQHYPVILNCLGKKWCARQIHAHLALQNLNFSYSTVARFVASLLKVQKRSEFTAVPGREAKIFLSLSGNF